jgi:hypothetical protein
MKKIVIIALLLLTTGFIEAQQLKKVAVFDPEGKVLESIRHIVREEISNAIVNTPNYAVVERSMIEKVLAESKFQSGGLVDDSEISELGRMMGADYVCYGSIAGIGENYYISLKMVDVVTARVILQRTGTTEKGMNDLIMVVESLAYQLVNKTGRTKEELEHLKSGGEHSKTTVSSQTGVKGSGDVIVISLKPNPKDPLSIKILNHLQEKFSGKFKAIVADKPLSGSVPTICKSAALTYEAKYVAFITFTYSARTYFFKAELFDTETKKRAMKNVEKSVRVKDYTVDQLLDLIWSVYQGT